MALVDIPECLTSRRQWVVFDEHRINGEVVKTPRIPQAFLRAAVDDPSTWRTFKEACEDGAHPAFVLTEYDPFGFIDLDALKKRPGETDAEFQRLEEEHSKVCDAITETFQTYQEWSMSGKGVHIIWKGKLRGTGLKRRGLELYDKGRFVIFTGNRMNRLDVMDAPAQELEDLEDFMRQGTVKAVAKAQLPDGEEKAEDDVIINQLLENNRTRLLWEGKFHNAGDYPSQSEADFDFISQIFRKTTSVAQVKRIFSRSALYRPAKVWDYVERALCRIHAEREQSKKIAEAFSSLHTPVINGNHVEVPVSSEPKKRAKKEDLKTVKELADSLPEGLLKRLHKAYYDWSFYPHSEGSLVAALTSAMLLFSRAYQTSTGLALKQYMILLAQTGSGKDIITKGPNELLSRLVIECTQHMWRGKARSEQGLLRMLSENPRMVSYLGECGQWMKDMCDGKGTSFDGALREALTTAWSASDDNGVMSPNEKGEKGKIGVIRRPCLTLLGDSQPTTFYNMIDANHALTGWLPRFVIIEAPPTSMAEQHNKNRVPLPEGLVAEYKLIFNQMLQRDHNGQVTQIPMTEEAEEAIDGYQSAVRRKMITAGVEDDRLAQLINRNGAKARVFAALLAVCADWHNPICTEEHVRWAIAFVDRTSHDMQQRMLSGDFDSAVTQQRPALESLINRLMQTTYEERAHGWRSRYFTSEVLRRTPHYIPLSIVRSMITKIPSFRDDKRYAASLDAHLRDMVRDGEIFLFENKDDSAWQQARCRGALICVATSEYWKQHENDEIQ